MVACLDFLPVEHYGQTLRRLVMDRFRTIKAFIAESGASADTVYRHFDMVEPGKSHWGTYKDFAAALGMSVPELDAEWKAEGHARGRRIPLNVSIAADDSMASTMDDESKLSSYILDHMADAGLTVEDLAERTGIPLRSVVEHVRAHAEVSDDEQRLYATALGIKFEDFQSDWAMQPHLTVYVRGRIFHKLMQYGRKRGIAKPIDAAIAFLEEMFAYAEKNPTFMMDAARGVPFDAPTATDADRARVRAAVKGDDVATDSLAKIGPTRPKSPDLNQKNRTAAGGKRGTDSGGERK